MRDKTEVIQKSFEDAKQMLINAVNMIFLGPLSASTNSKSKSQNLQRVPNLTSLYTDIGGHDGCVVRLSTPPKDFNYVKAGVLARLLNAEKYHKKS